MRSSRGLNVVASGPSLLIEDLGRSGHAHLGVPHSGALDPAALALANRLVANPSDAAGFEILLGGCEFVADRSLRIALTGAPMPLLVDGVAMPWGTAVSVKPGQQIQVGTTPLGLRSWLAVAGGIQVAPVLGSRSTDTLTDLGPPRVAAGDVIEVGAPEPHLTGAEAVLPATDPHPVTLRATYGPRCDWFTDEARGLLRDAELTVSPDSDRVALRLSLPADARLTRSRTDELPSEGLVTGAVQVPASGQPLIFLADHPVTGGYPVIAVIDQADLPRCAQLRPGDTLSLAV